MASDKAGEFYRKSFHALFAYVSHRIPEISDDLYKIDDALRAGFGWELGPFETWDAVGVKKAHGRHEGRGHHGVTMDRRDARGRAHAPSTRPKAASACTTMPRARATRPSRVRKA